MGELPSARVQPSRTSLTTGIDYAGPMSLRLGNTRSKTITKGYVTIFVCFVTKVFHIEMVTSLTSCCPETFICTSSEARTIYSDSGTNFQGASNQLLQSSSQMARVQEVSATEGCDWRFIPTHGRHFGGLLEAAAKSMKYHLRRTSGVHNATY